jgi:hypothetical protein
MLQLHSAYMVAFFHHFRALKIASLVAAQILEQQQHNTAY